MRSDSDNNNDDDNDASNLNSRRKCFSGWRFVGGKVTRNKRVLHDDSQCIQNSILFLSLFVQQAIWINTEHPLCHNSWCCARKIHCVRILREALNTKWYPLRGAADSQVQVRLCHVARFVTMIKEFKHFERMNWSAWSIWQMIVRLITLGCGSDLDWGMPILFI